MIEIVSISMSVCNTNPASAASCCPRSLCSDRFSQGHLRHLPYRRLFVPSGRSTRQRRREVCSNDLRATYPLTTEPCRRLSVHVVIRVSHRSLLSGERPPLHQARHATNVFCQDHVDRRGCGCVVCECVGVCDSLFFDVIQGLIQKVELKQ